MNRSQTKVIHLSWEEISEMSVDLSNMIPKNVVKIKSADKESRILALMVAEHLGIAYSEKNGYSIGITNLSGSDYCLYDIEYADQTILTKESKSINTIRVETDESVPSIIPPWKRL